MHCYANNILACWSTGWALGYAWGVGGCAPPDLRQGAGAGPRHQPEKRPPVSLCFSEGYAPVDTTHVPLLPGALWARHVPEALRQPPALFVGWGLGRGRVPSGCSAPAGSGALWAGPGALWAPPCMFARREPGPESPRSGARGRVPSGRLAVRPASAGPRSSRREHKRRYLSGAHQGALSILRASCHLVRLA
jgi:hypothetical protein